MASGTAAARREVTTSEIRQQLEPFIDPFRILTRPIDLIAFASDASFYRLIPKAVVLSQGVDEIQKLFRFSHDTGVPLTFRASGTSLSGQAITDGVLVEVARNWRKLQVEEKGRKVSVQPGVIGNNVNVALRLYGAKMGPDPASIATCAMGGILSNNSSGMCCGVDQNAYHTLDSLTFVLPSGTVINTADADADQRFRAAEPLLYNGIIRLKQKIENNAPLRDRIRAKYRMKNTTGYSLNAFIDFEKPVDIFQHVLIGAEGTLAFIAEAVLNTVPDLLVKYTGLLLFPDLYAAAAAIVPLREAGAKALEIMDRAALRSVEDQPGVPASLKTLSPDAAGLLVEFQAAKESERAALEELARTAVAGLKLVEPAQFTHVASEQAALWKIRAGMFPSVGSVRKSGTTVIIEDVAFPIARLADAALDLNKLFAKHGYDNAIIFGHAKDGNLHFVITQSFNEQAAVDQYARFMDDVVKLVVERYDGALKAEHGTGRNMAPFVEAEWGHEAYEVMQELKQLCDPENLLNPGVIINPDRNAHLADLKRMPVVEEEVDKCIECGYCEPKCPSRELTLTPRQRIVVRREMARLQNGDRNPQLLVALDKEFPYMALDTCATDGLCATACPVSIDTGQLTKRFRTIRHSASAQRWALTVARHFALTEKMARVGLRMGHIAQAILGLRAVGALSRALNAMTNGALPKWQPDVPRAQSARPPFTKRDGAAAVYFPSCISRTMGENNRDRASLMETLVAIADRAGKPVFVPPDVAGTCCGTPFSSKGFDKAHDYIANAAIERMWNWSDQGRIPVVIDTSPCTYGLTTSRSHLTPENQARFDKLRIIDAITWTHDELLPALHVTRKTNSAVLHPVCSVTKMNLTSKLEGIARACSQSVTTPQSAGCCAFAGDRGFLVPELTASATKHEAAEVNSQPADAYLSSSRTCEIGMKRATGHDYESYLFLLEESTRQQ